MAKWFNVLHAKCNVGMSHMVHPVGGSLPEDRSYLGSLCKGFASIAKWSNALHANCNAGMSHKVHTKVKAYYLKLVPI